MFGSATIEVILGLVFIFLLLSIVCSTINEWIAGILQLRGKTLRKGIYQLLKDHSYPEDKDWLANAFYNHPLVRGLANTKEGDNNTFPSYIPAETFSRVLIDLVLRGEQGDGQPETKPLREYYGQIHDTVGNLAKGGNRLAKVLLTLIDQAGLDESKIGEIQAGWARVQKLRARLEESDLGVDEIDSILRTIDRMETKVRLAEERVDDTIQNAYSNVEAYFDNMMDRVSGWYKRGVQFRTVFLAFAVTLLLNVDSIDLFSDLSNNPALRESVVAAAERPNNIADTVTTVTDDEVGNAPTVDAAIDAIEKLGLNIGWNEETTPQTGEAWFNRALGWLLTTIAVSMGTPFWFDIFNRVSNLRLAGRKPETGVIAN